MDAKEELSLKQFTVAVGQLKFRGTSLLLRAPISPVGRQHKPSQQQQQDQQQQQQQDQQDQQQDQQQEDQQQLQDQKKQQNQQQYQSSKDIGALPEVLPAKKYKVDDDDENESEDMEYEAVSSQQETANSYRAKEAAQPELEAYGYSIATHFVQVRSSGLLSDVKSLWQLADTDAVTKSVKTLLEHTKPGFQRFSSIHAFDKVNDS